MSEKRTLPTEIEAIVASIDRQHKFLVLTIQDDYKKIRRLQEGVIHMEKFGETLVATQDAMRGLSEDWRVSNRGYDRCFWHLVTRLEIGPPDTTQPGGGLKFDIVFAEELVDDLDAARLGRPVSSSERRHIDLVPLSSTLRLPCPHCQRDGLVVIGFQQLCSSVRGSSWCTEAFVICPSMDTLSSLAKRLYVINY